MAKWGGAVLAKVEADCREVLGKEPKNYVYVEKKSYLCG